MSEALDYLIAAVLIGGGATIVMDAWTIARTKLFGGKAAGYGLVGRWLAYMPCGRFRHDPIAASAPIAGERIIGWTAHYLIGIAFAALLLAVFGLAWARHPTIGPALLVGIGTIAAPFLLMQPGMGAGIAASRTPRPTAARMQSIMTHAVFGFGLYATARLLVLLRVF